MALQTSGAISSSDVQGEFGGTNPISLSEYYSAATGVPATGNPISLSDFYGTANTVTFTYELIGGGGGGGRGRDTGQGQGGRGGSGGTSSISSSEFTTITASGAQGGDGAVYYPGTNTANVRGDASYYGAGGAPGSDTSSTNNRGGHAPSSSYGAGGGGGGGDFSNSKADPTGYRGEGGDASTRITGTETVVSGTTISITIGAKGIGYDSGQHTGGNGAAGFAKITVDGVSTNFTSSGTMTLTS